MSSEANIQIVQKAYADFSRGDVLAFLAILDPSVEWVVPGDLPDSGTFRGPAEVLKFFQAVGQTWTFTVFNPVEFVASGDKVVAVGNYAGISNATGQSLTADWVMVWTFRDGMVTRFQQYTDTLATHYASTSSAAA